MSASVPVLKPRSANSRTSSIGLGVRSSQRTNATSAAAATASADDGARSLVQPASAPSMIAVDERTDADAGQHEARQVDHGFVGVCRVRREHERRDEGDRGEDRGRDEASPATCSTRG